MASALMMPSTICYQYFHISCQGFLTFLVQAGKEENACHIIMGTWDSFMVYWLEDRE